MRFWVNEILTVGISFQSLLITVIENSKFPKAHEKGIMLTQIFDSLKIKNINLNLLLIAS